MTSIDRVVDELALRTLAARYALGVDDHDDVLFAATFLPDARLRFFRPADTDVPSSDITGRAALSGIPSSMASRYDRTFHFVGQSVYSIADDEATGIVYCIAHHLTRTDHGGTDHVMHLRYDDSYGRDAAGEWGIASRNGHVEWTETRAVDLP